MFEERLTIAVKGISFDMILVEGDRFCIGNREVELDDFYIAEIPVTQELYMAVKGPAHTGSYNMMPDNFDYLDPQSKYFTDIIYPNESFEERFSRHEREARERSLRIAKEEERIRILAASLPVNNISWIDAIKFIEKLNDITGLSFALPSFEQWYFAASGGIDSKGFAFAGSDYANDVGHFNQLSTKPVSQGLFVMKEELDKPKKRKAASVWYCHTKQYLPNELGLYDMSGLVNEWTDKAGMLIGGSFYSNPDEVSKSNYYGYKSYNDCEKTFHRPFRCYVKPSSSYFVSSNNLYGFRIILQNKQKEYSIPQEQKIIINPSQNEDWFCSIIEQNVNLGLIRSFFASKYQRYSVPHLEDVYAFGSWGNPKFDIFLCPQNIPEFKGQCFENYNSKRKFISFCKNEFEKLIRSLSYIGVNFLIKDNLGLDLTESSNFTDLNLDFEGHEFKPKDKLWVEILSSNKFITNNEDIVQIIRIESSFNNKYLFSRIKFLSNTILIEINKSINVNSSYPIDGNWMLITEKSGQDHDIIIRASLNCFCFFCEDTENFIDSLKSHLIRNNRRKYQEYFTPSEELNRLFGRRSQGGIFELNLPKTEGRYLVLDDHFYILPQIVFEELSQSLKK